MTSLDELRCERFRLIALPRGVARLELNVPAFLPAQIAQTLADGGNAIAAKFWREETEQSEPGELPRRLGLGGEGRSEEDEGGEKESKLYYTSAAFGLGKHSSTFPS